MTAFMLGEFKPRPADCRKHVVFQILMARNNQSASARR